MPRTNPFPKDQAQICKQMFELRLLLRLSRVEFAKLVGLDSYAVVARERCLSPWKQSQIDAAFKAIETHLRESLSGFSKIAAAIRGENTVAFRMKRVDEQLGKIRDAMQLMTPSGLIRVSSVAKNL